MPLAASGNALMDCPGIRLGKPFSIFPFGGEHLHAHSDHSFLPSYRIPLWTMLIGTACVNHHGRTCLKKARDIKGLRKSKSIEGNVESLRNLSARPSADGNLEFA